ncbi:S8 family serine peptidase [Chryseobacterium sp. Tr-659]|uniref:S8 family peptidase n=1 Tax=Chryseobacterium sp. Tr-659 TaxID=2608340 RepID=UPI0014245A28|nr:S8 family peptidase [Chryseobacterium sp. Tr-659]NIF04188.1 S8 family serine peptidase [Chryseobacterium sp. Tr-659]
MKKNYLIIGVLSLSFLHAQTGNKELFEKFERQKKENSEKFDEYIKKLSYSRNADQSFIEKEKAKKNSLSFFFDGRPYFLKTNDENQVKNSNSDFLQNGNIAGLQGSFNGENIKYTVFDEGRVFEGHFLFNNLANRIVNKESNTLDYGSHATAVSSIIGGKEHNLPIIVNGVASNANLKGIAQNSTIDSYDFRSTTLPGNANNTNVYQKILIAQPKISNHSYGLDAGWQEKDVNGQSVWVWNGMYNPATGQSLSLLGSYYINDQYYDQIVYNNPSYIITKSAGNEFGNGPSANDPNPPYYEDNNGNPIAFSPGSILPQRNCAMGANCISPGSLAKNIIVVGATDIIAGNGGRYTASADVVHSSYSCAGPRDDGAIKPDITAVGTSLRAATTAEDLIGSQETLQASGTSFSSPGAAGIIGLWTQINKQLFNGAELDAASAKTLTVHSAAEAGNIGPDVLFGWGFIDAKKGAELLVGKSNNNVLFNSETLNNAVPNTKMVTASGAEPLKVTISWVDPAYQVDTNSPDTFIDNHLSRLVNDLDLRIIDTVTNTVYYPWKLTLNNPTAPAVKADNTVDNVEQVVIDAPIPGRSYRIEIGNKGAINSQNYSILATGFSGQVLATGEVVSKDNDVTIVPTITKDVTQILKASKYSEFSVYDMSGKKLQSGVINGDETAVNLSHYAKGIYIIEVKTKDHRSISKKIIKTE